jgi:hypothetical protein
MFDAIASLDSETSTAEPTATLPPAAMRCMRAASRADHQHAKALRSSAGGEHFQDHKRRARLLKVKEKRTEARSDELAWEAR